MDSVRSIIAQLSSLYVQVLDPESVEGQEGINCMLGFEGWIRARFELTR